MPAGVLPHQSLLRCLSSLSDANNMSFRPSGRCRPFRRLSQPSKKWAPSCRAFLSPRNISHPNPLLLSRAGSGKAACNRSRPASGLSTSDAPRTRSGTFGAAHRGKPHPDFLRESRVQSCCMIDKDGLVDDSRVAKCGCKIRNGVITFGNPD